MAKGNSEEARKAIPQVVENQLRLNDPPEVRETLDRLMGAGHSRAEAKRLIAVVLTREIFDVLEGKSDYDQERYLSRLQMLPDMPWEHE